jgi:hypothetical protein
MAYENHWPPGFNFNVEEWDAEGLHYETLAICRSLALARAVFAAAIAEKPMIRSRMRVVRRRALSISSIRLQISLYERGDGGFDEVSADLLCSGWRVALR